MRSRIVIQIDVLHEKGTATDLHFRMRRMLDGGAIQDAIINDMMDMDEEIESVDATVSAYHVGDDGG